MKRVISIILALTMLLCVLVSCAKPDDIEEETTPLASNETESALEETTTAAPVDTKVTTDIPDGTNFGGFVFNVLTRGTSSSTWYSRDIYSAGITGATIEDAVYNRNIAMEEKYGFEVKETGSTSPANDAKTSIGAGLDEYSMLCFKIKDDMTSLILQGYVRNLNNVSVIDLDKPYYDQNSRKSFSIDNKLYLVTGDLLTMDNDATRCTLFNKTLFNELNIAETVGGNLYKIMSDGKWTLDIMEKCATAATSDLNGDGTMDINDRYGMVSEQFNALAFFNSAGGLMYEKDNDDIPYFTGNQEKTLSMLSNIITMLNKDYCRHYSNGYNDAIPQFKEGIVLFYPAQLADVPLLRQMEFDFGIIPLPKYDETQENYVSPVTAYGSNCIAIPASVKDVDRAGTIIEVLSCESMNVVTDAYYEVNLKSKLARDEESGASMDIILDTAVFELAYMWSLAGVYDAICGGFNNNNPSLASSFKACEKLSSKTIEKYVEAIRTKGDK